MTNTTVKDDLMVYPSFINFIYLFCNLTAIFPCLHSSHFLLRPQTLPSTPPLFLFRKGQASTKHGIYQVVVRLSISLVLRLERQASMKNRFSRANQSVRDRPCHFSLDPSMSIEKRVLPLFLCLLFPGTTKISTEGNHKTLRIKNQGN